MLLECYATPYTKTKYAGRTRLNKRIIDLTNVRIRPCHKEDELGYCVLIRNNEKAMMIYETYESIINRIDLASMRGYTIARIGDDEYAS